jgi:hypothetical protein
MLGAWPMKVPCWVPVITPSRIQKVPASSTVLADTFTSGKANWTFSHMDFWPSRPAMGIDPVTAS